MNDLALFQSGALSAYLRETLPQCQYAKDLEVLLSARSDFFLRWTSDEVRLENYYGPPRAGKILTGVCYELTYQLGKRLQERFEADYLFMAADGNCPLFYAGEATNHTFIVAVPWSALERVIQHLNEGHVDLPSEVCVIDPSFRCFGLAGQDDVQGYSIRKVYDFEAISPTGDRCEVLPFQRFPDGLITTHTLPLGLLSCLAPELGEEEKLVVVGFQWSGRGGDLPVVFLGAKKLGDVYPVIRREWEVQLPQTNPLSRFLWRLRELIKVSSTYS